MNKAKRKIQGRPRPSESGMDLAAVGKRIRQLGERTTQEELARALGVSQAQLSKYESRQSAPPLRLSVWLSERFGRSLGYTVQGKGE